MFNKLKAATTRGKQRIMQTIGNAEETVDDDFNEKAEMYKNLTSSTKAIHSNITTVMGCMTALTAAITELAGNVADVYDENSPIAVATLKLKDAAAEMEESSALYSDNLLGQRALGPLAQYIAVFPEWKHKLGDRKKKLLDYDAATKKVKGLQKKPSNDPGKLPRAMEAQEDAEYYYNEVNDSLKAELPVFFANRFQVVDPAFEAILSSLVLYFNACNSSLKTVIPYVRDPTLKRYQGEPGPAFDLELFRPSVLESVAYREQEYDPEAEYRGPPKRAAAPRGRGRGRRGRGGAAARGARPGRGRGRGAAAPVAAAEPAYEEAYYPDEDPPYYEEDPYVADPAYEEVDLQASAGVTYDEEPAEDYNPFADPEPEPAARPAAPPRVAKRAAPTAPKRSGSTARGSPRGRARGRGRGRGRGRRPTAPARTASPTAGSTENPNVSTRQRQIPPGRGRSAPGKPTPPPRQ